MKRSTLEANTFVKPYKQCDERMVVLLKVITYILKVLSKKWVKKTSEGKSMEDY